MALWIVPTDILTFFRRPQSTMRYHTFHSRPVDNFHPWTFRTMVSMVFFNSTLVFIFSEMTCREWITVE